MDCEKSMTNDQEKDFINVLNKGAELTKIEMIKKLTRDELLLNEQFKAQADIIEVMKEALEEVIEMSKYVDNDRELRQYAKEALDRLKEIEG